MKLEDFRKQKGLTYEALAELIGGINASMAFKYCRKGARPRDPVIMQRIIDATDGKVTAGDMFGLAQHAA